MRSSERRWGGMHYWQNTRGQVAMVRQKKRWRDIIQQDMKSLRTG